METFIVGGNFGIDNKPSGIVKKLGDKFHDQVTFKGGSSTIINGGQLDDLPHEINSDLIIWMPNITNENKKQYPRKTKGNVLIVSKVIREGYSDLDAVARIFSMRGNAVIAIYKQNKDDKFFMFKLIDALGNAWTDTASLSILKDRIMEFYDFTRKAIRVPCIKNQHFSPSNTKNGDLDEFIELNKSLANYIQTSCGERFFGNLSTRCAKLFPTMKSDVGMFVSPRNVDKDRITPDDMVFCESSNNSILYRGNRKPSIDSPIQMKVYEECEQINYMIHGHAFVDRAVETSEYFLCGDLREAKEVIELIGKSKFGVINLKNHGFLMYSDDLNKLRFMVRNLNFNYNREDL